MGLWGLVLCDHTVLRDTCSSPAPGLWRDSWVKKKKTKEKEGRRKKWRKKRKGKKDKKGVRKERE